MVPASIIAETRADARVFHPTPAVCVSCTTILPSSVQSAVQCCPRLTLPEAIWSAKACSTPVYLSAAALARHRANVLLPPAPGDPGRVGQLVAAAGSTLFQLAQQLFGDGAEALLLQRAEDDELIQTAHQLRPEPLFASATAASDCFSKALRFRPTPSGALCPARIVREVGGQQDDGVAEIRLAAHGVGQLAVLEHL